MKTDCGTSLPPTPFTNCRLVWLRGASDSISSRSSSLTTIPACSTGSCFISSMAGRAVARHGRMRLHAQQPTFERANVASRLAAPTHPKISPAIANPSLSRFPRQRYALFSHPGLSFETLHLGSCLDPSIRYRGMNDTSRPGSRALVGESHMAAHPDSRASVRGAVPLGR